MIDLAAWQWIGLAAAAAVAIVFAVPWSRLATWRAAESSEPGPKPVRRTKRRNRKSRRPDR